ncbi:hypothetical protein BSR29_01320 [Boudabousia liubingyangii]|uniref:ABC transporter domain-containing protein n=2 Tax=Boudabousia liubingyangii TaxID=1921764 RepID=A0A1Q5PQ32_9ACTO|nr:hypothetical protein BSR28_01160 [Boudabousia liubingyangii]OKL49626.1 hypothetical protein BSR29_01320 [Boudabousia liubingyangii]
MNNHSSAKEAVAVSLQGVSKVYYPSKEVQIKAADQASLEVPAGQSVALMGPSGSGKSTLLHLIGLIDQADAGRITVGETCLQDLRGNAVADYRASIGIVFQQFYLINTLTLLENVAAPLVGRRPKREHRQLALSALEQVGLAERADSYPTQLSGGQQQRVAIARALVNEPKLLLADEPTGNLDSETSQQIMDLLLDLHQKLGLTMIIATHDDQVASRLDRIVRVKDGRIQ